MLQENNDTTAEDNKDACTLTFAKGEKQITWPI